mmetsp:Transcript_21353/g.61778  ORF Transcript_21353/g.61778 Transcript_21353/m.61778 type:complete len:341 (-) Transcript_21353:7-1029(-)
MAFFLSSSGLSASSFSQAFRAFLAHARIKSHLSMRLVSTSTCGSFSPSAWPSAGLPPSSCAAIAAAPASSASESLLSPSAAATASMPASSASESLLSSGTGAGTARPPFRAARMSSISGSCASSASESSLSPSSASFSSSSWSSSASFSASSCCNIRCCWLWCRLSSMTMSGFFLPSWSSFSCERRRLKRCMSVSPNSVMGLPISRSRSMTSPMPTGGSASSSSSSASSMMWAGSSFVVAVEAPSLLDRNSLNFRNRSSSSAFSFSSSARLFSKYSSTLFCSSSLRLTHFWPLSVMVFWAFAFRSASTDFNESSARNPFAAMAATSGSLHPSAGVAPATA